MPTHSDLNKWISDGNSLIEYSDFGANKEQVRTPRSENSPSNSSKSVVETCSDEKFYTEPSGKKEDGASKQITAPRPEDFNIAHGGILDDNLFLLGSEEESLVH
jgi:hypothetical protein